MLHNIIIALLIMLSLACLMQRNKAKFTACFVFVAVDVVHTIFLSRLGGMTYYFSCALFDLIIILMLSKIRPLTLSVLQFQYLSIVSIIFNFVGWAIWFNYYPPTAYNLAYIGLYLVALYIIIAKESTSVGSNEMGSRSIIFFSNPD